MSELIDNARRKKDLLKHMILQLHRGEAPEAVKAQLARVMGEVPYDHVVEVEQELISEGLPAEEVLRLCDIHTAALKGQISHQGAKSAPPGHPVDTFKQENRALEFEVDSLNRLYAMVSDLADDVDATEIMMQIRVRFNALTDVEKHYKRKENLLFPFLEQHGVTGPPTVMWGKHDETREKLRNAIQVLENTGDIIADEAKTVIDIALRPTSEAIAEMIYKEEEILFPMCMDTLNDAEWYSIYKQSIEIGFCLYDPTTFWKPAGIIEEDSSPAGGDRIQLPSGSFTAKELTAVLNTIPFDLTFVDKDDRVRYFTQGRERIFARNRAIIGRKVQLCHPPGSVHIVQRILDDFRSGRQERAPFWINLHGRFVHIEYFALRDADGEYLGTLEVSQDLTEKRALEGEQRLLAYAKE